MRQETEIERKTREIQILVFSCANRNLKSRKNNAVAIPIPIAIAKFLNQSG